MSGSKSKKSGRGSAAGGLTYKVPTGSKIPQIYGKDALTPPKTNDTESDWRNRQEALQALSKIRFNFQGTEASLCAKCDPQGVDGKAGKNTRNAVKAFQALAGLSVTGNWGETEDRAMFATLKSISSGLPIPCDPLLSYPSPLACFSLEDGSFGLMPSISSTSKSPSPSSSTDPNPQEPSAPAPAPSGPKYGPDELLVSDADCNFILHQDDGFFDEQRLLMIESALDGMTDGDTATEIHEEMMRRYIPMCLFLGKDQVGQGVKTWWSTNLAHVASSLNSYELLPDMLEEDAYKYGIL